MERRKSKLKFVSLHGHDCVGSPKDALGYPSEYMDFAYENGSDAIAFTNHGNCNGLSYQVEHIKKMHREGKKFKTIYGVEAYYHPDLDLWRRQRDLKKEQDALLKKQKKKDTSSDFVINDNERVSSKDLRHSRHLVLLAQNQKGLENIYALITKSMSGDNYYYKPRMDLKMLAEHQEGVIVKSACISGLLSNDFWLNQDKGREAILDAMRNTVSQFQNIFGDRFYGEIHFNGIKEQHKINLYVLKLSKEMGFKVVAACDHHYPRPEMWKDRFIYSEMRFLGNKSEFNVEMPESVESIGYELYPKNGDEMFESYTRYAEQFNIRHLYNDDEIIQTIEESHDIAMNRIENFYPDNKIRLPSFVLPEGTDPDRELRKKCVHAFKKMKDEGLIPDPMRYAKQVDYELEVIKQRGFAQYFLTMKAVFDVALKTHFTNPGRGSGAGSLVNYLLNITKVDPLKYNLLFSRFLVEPDYTGCESKSGVLTDAEGYQIQFSDGSNLFVTTGIHLKKESGYVGSEELQVGDVISGKTIADIEKMNKSTKIRHVPENTTKELEGISFYNPSPSSLPDIDSDFSRPMELKEELAREWGETCVVPISNFNLLKPKSLLKDLCKMYGIPFEESNQITQKMVIESEGPAKKALGMTSGMYNVTMEDIRNYSPTYRNFAKKYPEVDERVDALLKQVRNTSRHAGGVVISDDLTSKMPLYSSSGVLQTPWSEGQNVRHLEPMGFVKFDILGLETLEIMERCISNILEYRQGIKNPTFDQVKEWYDENMDVRTMDVEDQNVYQNVFHQSKWAGIFQFTSPGAQGFCSSLKPKSILELSDITTIYRPGPMGAGVHTDYKETKENPSDVEYYNDIHKEETERTHGFLLYQEQIAMLAYKLGDNISLAEANKLRKVITKKGTGSAAQTKEKIKKKLFKGCLDKGMSEEETEELWSTLERFSAYGFNMSHSISYCLVSYQCAWLLTYYEAEWLAAFLDHTKESDKAEAISIVKSLGYKIKGLEINKSNKGWGADSENKVLYQSFTSVKGLGDSTVDEIINKRPFHNIEDIIFNKEIKINKAKLDVLCRIGAFESLIESDDRFSGDKHMWCVLGNLPKPPTKTAQKKFVAQQYLDKGIEKKVSHITPEEAEAVKIQLWREKLQESIDNCDYEGSFTKEERIENLLSLTGSYPFDLVVSEDVVEFLEDRDIQPLTKWRNSSSPLWFVLVDIKETKRKGGKGSYLTLKVVDNSYEIKDIKVWSFSKIKASRLLSPHQLYVGNIKKNNWGYSLQSLHDKRTGQANIERINL